MKIRHLLFSALFCVSFCSNSFAQWSNQISGTTQHLNSIYATSNSNIYTVGAAGTGRKTTNAGTLWSNMSLGVATTQNSIRFLNSTSGFSTGDFQDILQTSNSGTAWANIGGGLTLLHDGYFMSASSGWVVGDIEVGYGFLYNPFTFNLIQITANLNKALRGVYFSNSTTGWVVGDGGLIIKTVNSGVNWTQQTSGTINQLNKVMFLDPNNGIAVGNSGTILKTVNGGTNWISSTSGTTQHLNAIYYADVSNLWACGDNGIILKSSDGGLSWIVEASGTTEKLNSIHGFGITDVWACGNNGKIIYRSGITSDLKNQSQTNFSIFPNPTNQNAMLEFDNFKTENCTLTLYDDKGQLVRSINNIISNSVEIERQNLTSGFHIFQLSANSKILVRGKLKIE